MGLALPLTDRPRAGSGLSNVTASIGQDVTLTCTTDANPNPTSYVWYHGGRVVSPTSSSSQWTVSVSNSSMLGSYSCIATNIEGASDSITVYVIQQTSGGGDTGGGCEYTSVLVNPGSPCPGFDDSLPQFVLISVIPGVVGERGQKDKNQPVFALGCLLLRLPRGDIRH